MDDELGERCVEYPAGKGQVLSGRLLNVRARIARSRSCDERLGRIDGRHNGRSYPLDQLSRERSGAAADVEHALTAGYSGHVGELR